jgi:hypothetical protein
LKPLVIGRSQGVFSIQLIVIKLSTSYYSLNWKFSLHKNKIDYNIPIGIFLLYLHFKFN